MTNLTIIDHPLIKRDVAILRDATASNHTFRTTLRRISSIMAFTVTHDLRVRKTRVRTPLEETTGYVLADDIVIVPVLRAGLGLIDGFLDVLPEARVGHVGLYRNERTLEPVDYYSKFPQGLAKSLVILLDPMLATGGSASAAITFLKRRGARRIRFAALVAAPVGVKRVAANHPDVSMYAAVLDRKLNDRGYILPGLGDAGDRLFGTE
ncbi:MAG: uracil phosphoribosyltransferase [Ignavibacteriae bacterium]|nr:uracil phosphoribosyltransferase [Ignavibacteriota bacterium]